MAEGGTPEGKKRRPWVIVAVIVIVIVVAATSAGYVLTPSLSPVPTIRDSDGDGVADAEDVFPNDPNEWSDTDGDGVGDNEDAFPNDSGEWVDSDGDGVGDNGDEFPLDPTESRDSDNDGIGDNADFWDMGNGGLLIRIERFELIAGVCDFLSNCEPSFRLEVDYDDDEVTDVSRRADFEDFLDTEPLVDAVDWVFDIPDDTPFVWVLVYVMELDIGADQEIDVHPDDRYIAEWVDIDSPFDYKKFVTEGDQEPIGRLTYSVAATGV